MGTWVAMTTLHLHVKAQPYLRNPPQGTWLSVGSWVWQKEPQIYNLLMIPFRVYSSEETAPSEVITVLLEAFMVCSFPSKSGGSCAELVNRVSAFAS